MGRAPCCDKTKVKRGPWSPEEDITLRNYVEKHGTGGSWIALPQKAGLKRCGKSCRLRWLNYLRPNIKHGGFSEEEDTFILTLYHNIDSRWSVIASQLPGRKDNDVKNYWNTKLKKKLLPAAAATATATAAYNMVPYYCPGEEIVDAQIPLPGLVEDAYNLQTPPFLAVDHKHANGSIAESWSSGSIEDDAFLLQFASGLMPYDLMNVGVDFHEHQVNHLSFGYSPSI